MFDQDSTLTLMQLAFPVGCKVRTIYINRDQGVITRVYSGTASLRVWIDVDIGNTIYSYEANELVLDED